MTTLRFALGSSAILCSLTLASQAQALSCAAPELGAPSVDSVDVPVNTRIWCGDITGDDTPDLRLAGESVTGTVSLITSPGLSLSVLLPDAPLEPNTTYEVHCRHRDWSFTTGAEEDLSVPEIPSTEVTSNVANTDRDWGNSIYAEFGEMEPNTILVIDINGEAEIDARAVSGTSQAIIGDPYGWPMVGYSLCDGNYNAMSGETIDVRLGLFNLSGEFSGWSDTETITFATLPDGTDPAPPTDPGEPIDPEDPTDPAPTTGDDSDPDSTTNDDGSSAAANDAGPSSSSTSSGCSFSPMKTKSPLQFLALFGAMALVSMARRRRA